MKPVQTLEETMTDQELNAEIEKAEAAAEAIREAQELSDQAAALDGLLKQRQAQQELRNAELTLERMTAATITRLERAKPAVSEWRSNFEKVCTEIEDLLNTLPVVQAEILDAGLRLQRASENLYYKINPDKLGRGDDDTSNIPAFLESQNGFSDLWSQLGGLDDSLDVFPKLTGLSAGIADLIKRNYKKTIYYPKKGHRFFMHK